MVLAGAFYPNYFTGSPPDELQALRELAGKDPCITVMVRENVPFITYPYMVNVLYVNSTSDLMLGVR